MMWVYGSHFVSYDNLKVILNKEELREEYLKNNEPLEVGYNGYGNFIWCRNLDQVKLFSLQDGELMALHPNITVESKTVATR